MVYGILFVILSISSLILFWSGFNSTINKIFFALLMAGLANRLPYALYLSFKAEADFVKDHGL